MRFAVPVLTYHAANIAGQGYADNDHVALAHDLETLVALGVRVVSAARVADAVAHARPLPEGRLVALTLDDGTDFDFRDITHPTCGPQRGMFGVVTDHLARHPERSVHVTSFVVVAPQARAELDRACLVGRGWWSDAWWDAAIASGRWAIANHSFDHHHPLLERSAAGEAPRGTFRGIVARQAADAEIGEAAALLRASIPNEGDRLFAYPYGEANDYLVRDYFPREHGRIGVDAAFATGGAPVTEASDRWCLPRYVCGEHWRSTADLDALLRDAFGPSWGAESHTALR